MLDIAAALKIHCLDWDVMRLWHLGQKYDVGRFEDDVLLAPRA
jgi:hypothetical protein